MTQDDQSKLARIPQSVIDALLDKVPLLDLVKDGISVKSSNNRHSAVCPFHTSNGNDLSLSIDNEERRFECSVCGFKGSAIGWLMYHDGLSFQDAIHVLGDLSDTDLSEWVSDDALFRANRKRHELMKDLENFYSDQLPHSAKALSYVKSRQLNEETLARFGIGYAPKGDGQRKKAFPRQDRALWNQGILIRHSDRTFAHRFNNRIMFPIRDIHGNTVGFGGRAIDESLPKYLNSPTSPAFNKKELLYGLYESLQASFGGMGFILVEGYLDVLSLHHAGFTGAVATLGTAPSEFHLQTLFSLSEHLVVCFDGDQAGLAAADRLMRKALPLLNDETVIEFMLLPNGQDPDSLIRGGGADAFSQQLSSRKSLESFFCESLSRELDLNTIGGKAALAASAEPLVISVTSDVVRESLIHTIEQQIGIPWLDEN